VSYRTILAAVSGGSAADGAVELAGRLAGEFGASLEGFHIQIDPVQIIATSFDGAVSMPLPTGWIDDLTHEAVATAAKARSSFLAAAERHQIPATDVSPLVPARAIWRMEIGDASSLLAARARFFDLIVLGRSERVAGNPHSDAIERVVCYSGRPVLIAPKAPPATLAEKIAICWNGSPQSVRAVSAAMPLLARAGTTKIFTIDADEEMDVASLRRYLEGHAVSAEHRSLRSDRKVDLGDRLIEAANDAGTDLLVLGGYGHMPWRETLFGGATRSVLRSSLFPILLAH